MKIWHSIILIKNFTILYLIIFTFSYINLSLLSSIVKCARISEIPVRLLEILLARDTWKIYRIFSTFFMNNLYYLIEIARISQIWWNLNKVFEISVIIFLFFEFIKLFISTQSLIQCFVISLLLIRIFFEKVSQIILNSR